ncbi:putative MPP superfamily phosphohydrolase [Cytobacillus eiseniae]|uniref:MPP superfamily phosphohydrolase n=1 Tax=Cytobacillus eiseniae TaxID=762947 RepID=A0ABS4RCU5_9BACI|nr:metallophosphoesterase [Cytobacillus eiseniae]MBP2240708.1 putative MPP superfamily phosphohydrolase [Cytobacillus eiseniae]
MGFFFIIAILLFVCFLIIYMIKEAFANRVIQLQMNFADFPETFGDVKLFFISDIHKREVTDQIIEEVQKLKVDIVIIGGDLLEKGVSFEKVKKNLQKLTSLGDVLFVWGNNDYEVEYRYLDALLLEYGVKILDNTAVFFESRKGERLTFLGVDDISQKRDRLDLALADAGEGGFKILVSHNPQIISQIEPEHQIRLVLSGHTHGGQIHILGYSPYEKGKVKKIKDTTLLISNGYGTTALPFRLGAKSETHLITLSKG